jgi:hypothetical protein
MGISNAAAGHTCTVNLGGKKLELVLGTGAIRYIEEATGRSFSEAGQRGGLSFLVLSVAAGLQHLPEFRRKLRVIPGEGPDLSMIDDWFDGLAKKGEPGEGEETLKSLGEKIGAAIRFGMPGVSVPSGTETPEVEARPTERPSPSTGKR